MCVGAYIAGWVTSAVGGEMIRGDTFTLSRIDARSTYVCVGHQINLSFLLVTNSWDSEHQLHKVSWSSGLLVYQGSWRVTRMGTNPSIPFHRVVETISSVVISVLGPKLMSMGNQLPQNS
jgi:hypothetical protein